jgi:hypothetical protein
LSCSHKDTLGTLPLFYVPSPSGRGLG